jgi:hypothetical protein
MIVGVADLERVVFHWKPMALYWLPVYRAVCMHLSRF